MHLTVYLKTKCQLFNAKRINTAHWQCRKMSASTMKSTVNAGEKEKFDSWDKDWWQKTKTLQKYNEIRVPFVREGILNMRGMKGGPRDGPKPLEGFSVVDAGCGGGILSEALARLGAKVTGLDVAPNLIRIAREHAKLDPSLDPNIKYECAALECYADDLPGHFDALVSSEVVEHVDNVPLFIESCAKLVKPGGSLFFTTINRTPESYLNMILFGEYLGRIIPLGTHKWSMFIKPEELQTMLENNNCAVRMIQGIRLSLDGFIYSNNNRCCYALHAVKYNKTLNE